MSARVGAAAVAPLAPDRRARASATEDMARTPTVAISGFPSRFSLPHPARIASEIRPAASLAASVTATPVPIRDQAHRCDTRGSNCRAVRRPQASRRRPRCSGAASPQGCPGLRFQAPSSAGSRSGCPCRKPPSPNSSALASVTVAKAPTRQPFTKTRSIDIGRTDIARKILAHIKLTDIAIAEFVIGRNMACHDVIVVFVKAKAAIGVALLGVVKLGPKRRAGCRPASTALRPKRRHASVQDSQASGANRSSGPGGRTRQGSAAPARDRRTRYSATPSVRTGCSSEVEGATSRSMLLKIRL